MKVKLMTDQVAEKKYLELWQALQCFHQGRHPALSSLPLLGHRPELLPPRLEPKKMPRLGKIQKFKTATAIPTIYLKAQVRDIKNTVFSFLDINPFLLVQIF
jgi:hypothetical protein